MLLVFLASSLPLAAAFSFAFKDVDETLTKCQSVEVIWQGGQPPFELLIIVSFEQAGVERSRMSLPQL